MARIEPEVLAHLEWLGFVQPTGLVVSAPALARAGAILNRTDAEGQRLLRECLAERVFKTGKEPESYLPDFRAFATKVLGWNFSPKAYAGTEEAPIPPELEVALPAFGEVLRPDYAVRDLDPGDGKPKWQLLVRVLGPGADFDAVHEGGGQLEASTHSRMERLLRRTGITAGLLFNGRAIRLISAPPNESSGWFDFRVGDMLQTQGRPICAALRLLLSQTRLLAGPRSGRLTALLEDSRKFQNEVSERLAEQVLHALYELLRGLQAAHDASRGELLRKQLEDHPDEIYRALLTVILRLVFLLYAEERDMLPKDETFLRYYSLAGLHERLREDAALYPDTMDQRFGAWSQLLVLFRLIYEGASHGDLHLPQRHGVLFDPDRFPFLEGRCGATREAAEWVEVPLVPDGTIYRALEKLLILDGERLSYRALGVEHIGSVYETMMGFRLEQARGRSLAIRSKKRQGAPTTIDLEELLAQSASARRKWLQEQTGRDFADRVQKGVREAETIEDLHAALESVVDQAATPDLVPPAAMVLQPSDERRKSGSHYTPRALTEPIVWTTLEPILGQLAGDSGGVPTPEQILELKVCDPAMGSGAFLVETCRQLGAALVESWKAHGGMPDLPADEDEQIFAQRLVAQRCLYGVDRNPVAVDLAKMSLWLATLARDHPLTFVDHALRHGDSLVGVTRKQIEAFRLDADEAPESGFETERIRTLLSRLAELRSKIREAGENVSYDERHALWSEAQQAAREVAHLGDLLLLAFFEGENVRDRERLRSEYAAAVVNDRAAVYWSRVELQRQAELPLVPFHWEIEFPEVFGRAKSGFDAIVGNPPFLGGRNLSASLGDRYADWLKTLHEQATGGADLAAHFFRRSFDFIRNGGTFGLIATNTISQGETRGAGLRWIRRHGGTIFSAKKRIKWPGPVAVVVSTIHIARGPLRQPILLDGRTVPLITAFLFHRGGDDDPAKLATNAGKGFQGSIVLGMGFTFDDTDSNGIASSLAEMRELIEKDERNAERIFPYIGGEEVNSSPTHAHHRYVINFGEMGEAECRRNWPDLMAIVEAKVKPERITKDARKYPRMVNEWWKFWNARNELPRAIASLDKVLVTSRVRAGLFALIAARMVFSEQLVVFPNSSFAFLSVLQCRIHEVWMRFFSGTALELIRYTPSDCFETFPFPEGWETDPHLEAFGREYYEFRADLMVSNDEGLTKTYNRFHDPDEADEDILRLRKLHAAMDRAVLDAYGWRDIPTDCEFLLDYEDEDDDGSKRKRPWRYRWPDDVRDEVLARLLELNRVRADAESRERQNGAATKRSHRNRMDGAAKDLFS